MKYLLLLSFLLLTSCATNRISFIKDCSRACGKNGMTETKQAVTEDGNEVTCHCRE